MKFYILNILRIMMIALQIVLIFIGLPIIIPFMIVFELVSEAEKKIYKLIKENKDDCRC